MPDESWPTKIVFSKEIPEDEREEWRELLTNLVKEHGKEKALEIVKSASAMILLDLPLPERKRIDDRKLGATQEEEDEAQG
jgi:hypothetical protein